MQAMLLSSQGLVIRNGSERVLIPRESVLKFRCELEKLLQDSSVRAG